MAPHGTREGIPGFPPSEASRRCGREAPWSSLCQPHLRSPSGNPLAGSNLQSLKGRRPITDCQVEGIVDSKSLSWRKVKILWGIQSIKTLQVHDLPTFCSRGLSVSTGVLQDLSTRGLLLQVSLLQKDTSFRRIPTPCASRLSTYWQRFKGPFDFLSQASGAIAKLVWFAFKTVLLCFQANIADSDHHDDKSLLWFRRKNTTRLHKSFASAWKERARPF